MDASELARRVKGAGLDIPVILLAYDGGELAEFMANRDTTSLERIFLWQGDSRILLAITKYMEDKLNVAYDTGVAGVQVILLIEDNIRYYSSFLPLIYTEIINHSQHLISEGLNVAHKILRMRARPKILLCTSFEEAWDVFSAYRENVLGVISDIEFPQEGRLNPQAGAEFARKVRTEYRDIPILLQSSRPESEALVAGGGRRVPVKGLAHAARRPASLHRGQFLLRRLHLPASGWHRGRSGKGPQEPAGDAQEGARRIHHLSCRAQPLLHLAQGPN